MKAEWDKADSDKSGSLTLKEVTGLLDKLNLKLKKTDVKKKFKVSSVVASCIKHLSQQQEVDADSSGHLDFDEFQVFLERLRVRPEVDELFYKIAKNGCLTPEEFKKWINTEQGEDLPLETVKNLIAQLEKKEHGKDATKLFVTGFSAYLASPQYNRYSLQPSSSSFV